MQFITLLALLAKFALANPTITASTLVKELPELLSNHNVIHFNNPTGHLTFHDPNVPVGQVKLINEITKGETHIPSEKLTLIDQPEFQPHVEQLFSGTAQADDATAAAAKAALEQQAAADAAAAEKTAQQAATSADASPADVAAAEKAAEEQAATDAETPLQNPENIVKNPRWRKALINAGLVGTGGVIGGVGTGLVMKNRANAEQ